MTFQEYREYIKKNKATGIKCFGIDFNLLDTDIVILRTNEGDFELTMEQFKDVENDFKISDDIWYSEIQNITIKKNERQPHCMSLILDETTKNKPRKIETLESINARMKFR